MTLTIHYLKMDKLREMEKGINLEEISPKDYLSRLRPLTQTAEVEVKDFRGYLPEIELTQWAKGMGGSLYDFAMIVGGKNGIDPDQTFPSTELEIVAQYPDMVDAPCEYRDTWCDYK